MNPHIIPLEALQIARPCRADWNAMTGDERARFCGSCEKNVYDISQMTRAQAHQLIAQHEGGVCVRLYRRADGTVITADCPVGQTEKPRPLWQMLAGLAALSLASLAGCATHTTVSPAAAVSPVAAVSPIAPVALAQPVAPPPPPMSAAHQGGGFPITNHAIDANNTSGVSVTMGSPAPTVVSTPTAVSTAVSTPTPAPVSVTQGEVGELAPPGAQTLHYETLGRIAAPIAPDDAAR